MKDKEIQIHIPSYSCGPLRVTLCLVNTVCAGPLSHT